MKTVTLTKAECDIILSLHESMFCHSGCLMEYERIDCDDIKENGEYRCKFARDLYNLQKKVGLNE
jgi:hypothetical protein